MCPCPALLVWSGMWVVAITSKRPQAMNVRGISNLYDSPPFTWPTGIPDNTPSYRTWSEGLIVTSKTSVTCFAGKVEQWEAWLTRIWHIHLPDKFATSARKYTNSFNGGKNEPALPPIKPGFSSSLYVHIDSRTRTSSSCSTSSIGSVNRCWRNDNSPCRVPPV